MKTQYLEWVLRLGVAGEFIGHGVFALGSFLGILDSSASAVGRRANLGFCGALGQLGRSTGTFFGYQPGKEKVIFAT